VPDRICKNGGTTLAVVIYDIYDIVVLSDHSNHNTKTKKVNLLEIFSLRFGYVLRNNRTAMSGIDTEERSVIV